jgi:hypothetical protein
MAKKIVEKEVEKGTYNYPSRFGSHAAMIDKDRTEKLKNPDLVVCKDEFGFYTTEKKKLDSGVADPNRYDGRGKWEQEKKKKEE